MSWVSRSVRAEDRHGSCLSPGVSWKGHLLAFPGACGIPGLSQLPRHMWDGTKGHSGWDAGCSRVPATGSRLLGRPHEPAFLCGTGLV